MIVLKSVKQINDKINSIFNLEKCFGEDDFSFINSEFDEKLILSYIKNTSLIENKENDLEELSLLIFQLKNYIPALCNLTNFFLLSKNYDAVYFFTTKLFISHVGAINYSSHGNYTFKERFFDRFIEIIKNCNISPENYFPFLLYIFNSGKADGVDNWRAPCLEYLQTFYNENKQLFMNFIENTEYKYELIFLLSRFNTQKALMLIFEYFNLSQPQTELLEILKGIKKETLLYIDQNLSTADEMLLEKIYSVLVSFQDDTEAKSRIVEVYKRTENKLLRDEISTKLGISENHGAFKGEKNFLFAVRRVVKEEQKRVFSLAFENCDLKYKSGLKADYASYTYLLNIFKEDKNILNLPKYLSLYDVFDDVSLNNFVEKVYNLLIRKQDIKSTKWLIRLVSVLYKDYEKMYEFVELLFKQNRSKEGKYFFECLTAAKRDDIIFLMRKLKCYDNFNKDLGYYVKTICDFYKYDIAKVSDLLLNTNDNEQEQKERMFQEFLCYRQFSQEYFNDYINLPIISKLCEKLIFGEYKFDRLYSAFVIEDKKRKYIVSEHTADSYIAVIHPQDIDDRFLSIVNYFSNPTFNQFEKVEFNTNDFDRSVAIISSCSGMIVAIEKFKNVLQKFGFKENLEKGEVYYNSLISIYQPLNIACEIQFEGKLLPTSTYATISSITFYKLNQLLKSNGKYITQKQDALTISNLPYRYFAYIMTKLLNCAKASV